MANSSSLVDRAARAALREVKHDTRDLLKDGFPFEPASWHIVVEPQEPRVMSDGGIMAPVASQEAEAFQNTVGRVLKCGPAAMEGRTTGGIELSNFLPGISRPAQLIGKFVLFQSHVGQLFTLRRTDQSIRVIKLAEILGVTDDPNAWKFYL